MIRSITIVWYEIVLHVAHPTYLHTIVHRRYLHYHIIALHSRVISLCDLKEIPPSQECCTFCSFFFFFYFFSRRTNDFKGRAVESSFTVSVKSIEPDVRYVNGRQACMFNGGAARLESSGERRRRKGEQSDKGGRRGDTRKQLQGTRAFIVAWPENHWQLLSRVKN